MQTRLSAGIVRHPAAWGSVALGALLLVVFGPSSLARAKDAVKSPAPATPQQAEFFEKKIRPFLTDQCVPCHSETVQLGGVRLDTAEGVWKTLNPEALEKSRLLQVVGYDSKIKMPPSGKRPSTEIAALTEWVKMGAPWPEKTGKPAPGKNNQQMHWSFRPVRRPALPAVKKVAWCASPIDRFVMQKLEAKNLAPAPAAQKRALIRRAYFDLTGLPPTPEQVEAFVADKSPDAFAKVVDRLLASPQYGERWARHWLDVARYADSNGLDENVAFAYAWRYRDWVVSALNQDKPYDAFLREQIAGDLMDSGSNENLRNARLTATGFLTLGAKVLAEPDKKKMAMDIVDEQIEVVTKATMGLTVSCARCHDHKFDPISTKDYYALAGILKSTKTMATLNTVARVNERPLMTQDLDIARKRYEESLKPLEAATKQAKEEATAHFNADLKRGADAYLRAGWELSRRPGVLLSVADTPERPGNPKRTQIETITFARGNAIRDKDTYGKGLGVIVTGGGGAPVWAEWDLKEVPAGRYQVELRYAAEESRPVRLLVNSKVVREKSAPTVTGSWMPEGQRWEAQAICELTGGANTLRIERLDGPLPHISRILLVPVPATTPLGGEEAVERTRLAVEEIAKREKLVAPVLQRVAGRLVGAADFEAERTRLKDDTALFAAPDMPEAFYAEADKAAIKKAEEALAAARKTAPQIPMVMAVTDDEKPEDVPVHIRGSVESLGDMVPRGFPAILTRTCAAVPVEEKTSGRLAFAQWLTRPQHPLTARVQVNRVWQHLFGDGLVRTPDNWGLKGETPTHPELLDYLTATFIKEDGWSQKRLIRRIMLSSAYRMAATAATPQVAQRASLVDPENRLLWRQNRRRLEAEPYRDAMLAVAGTLDKTIGGSLLTTPDHDYVTNDQSADKAQYSAPRRSLYLPVIRNAIYDEFQAFDFGDGTTVNARRASTTVAPQALLVMNSPLARDASLTFARTLLKDPNAPDTERVRRAYYRALGRPATATEVTRAVNYLNRYDAALAARETDTAKRRERSWQSLCQALLASNEFLTLN